MENRVSVRSTVVAARDQVSSDLGDEVAILDLRAGVYYGLDTVGARIWGLIQEPRIVGEVRDTLLTEYEVEPDRCERDLVTLLQRLAEEGLLQRRSFQKTTSESRRGDSEPVSSCGVCCRG